MPPLPVRLPFPAFYRQVFLPEHRHPANVALHVAGTLVGLGFLAAVAARGAWPWALLFPVVHAVPGLVGHRLFERNAVVGDVRVLRTDYPGWWFLVANHRLAVSVLTGRWSAARTAAEPRR